MTAPASVSVSISAAVSPRRAAPRPRLEWLDLYRGLAVLVMIETHVANTFLAPALRESEWFIRLTFLNGLVAPAFLFIAGYAQALGSRRKPSRPLLPRLRRLAGIAAIGYGLHFPWTQLLSGDFSGAWRSGTIVDILPCLAVSLGLLLIVQRWKGRRSRIAAGLVLGAVLVLAEPLSGWTGAAAWAVPLMAFVNHSTGSLFPLLPWAGFAVAGWLVADDRRPGWTCALAGLGCAAAAILFVPDRFSAIGPVFFVERLGWVLLLIPVSVGVARWAAPGLVLYAGRESLAMYIAHLLIIPKLSEFGFAALDVPRTTLLYGLVLAASFAGSWAWRWGMLRLRRRWP